MIGLKHLEKSEDQLNFPAILSLKGPLHPAHTHWLLAHLDQVLWDPEGIIGLQVMWQGISGSLPQSWVCRPGAPSSHSANMLSNFNTRDLFNHFFCETAKGNPGLWWVGDSGTGGQSDLGGQNGTFLSGMSLWLFFCLLFKLLSCSCFFFFLSLMLYRNKRQFVCVCVCVFAYASVSP